MGRWTWSDDGDQEVFVIPGPMTGQALLAHFGGLFPEDAEVGIERASGSRENASFGALGDLHLDAGDSLTLPGIPVAGGPLVYVMGRLLAPDGCPWDKKQTPESLLRYLLDESYEAAEALMADDRDAFIEELGDVLLQIAFQGALLSGTSFHDIAKRQAAKLVRRHPHVFQEALAESSDEVRQQWERLKAEEPPHEGSARWVYPSLVAAKRLSKDGINPESPVYQEISALLEVYFDKSPGKIEEILADAAWAVAQGGRIQHQDAEWALWKKVAETAREKGATPSKVR